MMIESVLISIVEKLWAADGQEIYSILGWKSLQD